MANVFHTPAAVSLHKEPPLEVLAELPPPPEGQPLISAGLMVATALSGVLLPAAAPGLFLAWAGWLVLGVLGRARREEALILGVARLAHQACRRMGPQHPLVTTLRRYHRLLLRLSAPPSGAIPLRVLARRRALAHRLAHRSQSMLQEWPLFADPCALAPRHTPLMLPPAAPALPARPGPMVLRSRGRRGRPLMRHLY